MGSVRWRTAIGRPLFFFSQEITIRLIKKDKGVMEDKKLTMPMIALRGLTVLPQMTVNFDIIRDKSIAAVEQAMVGDQRVFLATQKQPDEVIPDIDGIFQVGTIGYVKQLVKMPGGMVRVTVEGQERAELLEMEKGEACCTAIVEILDPVEDDLDTIQKEAMLRILKEKLEEYGKLNVAAGREVLSPLIAQPDLTELMNQISAQFPWNYEARQSVLECRTLTEMYETELQLLLTELEVYRVKREFQTKVKAALDKNQRDYILREQLRVIREELGEENPLDAYILCLDPSAKLKALQITTELRSNGYRCEMDYLGRSFKAQFKTVDRRGARIAIMIGDREINEGTLSLKETDTQKQHQVPMDDIVAVMDRLFDEGGHEEGECACGHHHE